MKILSISLLALSVIATAGATTGTAGSEERPALRPFVGETAAEFEARKNGKARPETNVESSSVMLIADPSGHFSLTSIIDGVGVRMVVDTGANIVTLRKKMPNELG
jgi:predicted aspartyl protease